MVCLPLHHGRVRSNDKQYNSILILEDMALYKRRLGTLMLLSLFVARVLVLHTKFWLRKNRDRMREVLRLEVLCGNARELGTHNDDIPVSFAGLSQNILDNRKLNLG